LTIERALILLILVIIVLVLVERFL